MTDCSLIISTYNWPQALHMCLQSVMLQTVKPTEVIICDDGSGEETKILVEHWQKNTSLPIIHVWQEDNGFQLARIRNKGFAAANTPYLIQIDGDLLLHKDFIKDHCRFAKQGYFTTGSRVLLSEKFSRELIQKEEDRIQVLFKKNNNMLNSLHVPLLQSLLAKHYKQKGKWLYYVKGCNMAFWKSDMLLVNGYNEAFTGWGKEDSEIAIRLMNAGISKRFLKFGGICYHLYHAEASRTMEESNTRLMERSIEDKIIEADLGIDQHL